MIVTVNDRSATALIDSGCSKTVVLKGLVMDCMLFSGGESMVLANGKGVRVGSGEVQLNINGRIISVECSVMEHLPYGLGILIGMDVIGKLGGVRINKN